MQELVRACCLHAAIILQKNPALLVGLLLDRSSCMAMASDDRVEVDTARPFRSVKEAVAVFGERILVGGDARSRSNAIAVVIPNSKHEASNSSSATVSPDAMATEIEEEQTAAIVPMYSAPSSPPSRASSSPDNAGEADDEDDNDDMAVMSSVKKLEGEVAETRQEVAQLRKRGSEMEMAVASLSAQLHRGLSRLAEMEADRAAAAAASAARRSVGGDSDLVVTPATFRSERWGGGGGGVDRSYSRSSGMTTCGEYLPSFSHALSLGEVDDGGGGRRRKAQKVKPIVPLIGDILFSKRKSTKGGGGDGFYSGDLYSVLG